MLSHRTLPSAGSPVFTIVLLHAFPLSSAMWDGAVAEIEALRDDCEFVLVDLPGFGEAPVASEWTMSSAAAALRSILRAEGADPSARADKRRIVLGGLSMGGYVALQFYREYGSMLSGLIFSDTKAEEDTEAQKRLRGQFAQDALKRGPQAAVERLYSGFVTESTEPEIAVEIQNWMLSAKPEAISAALLAMRDRPDSTDLLPVISLPTAVIVGEKDTTCPPDTMRAMAHQIAHATFEVIPEAAHLSAVEKPREWAAIVSSFLDRLPI
jgi:pimeloyl-ACP methyl ester carboxylesterase